MSPQLWLLAALCSGARALELRGALTRRVFAAGTVATVAAPAFAEAPPAELQEAAAAERKVFKKAIGPLYKRATFDLKTRKYLPGEVHVPTDFVQGDDSVFIGSYTDPNHPGGTRTIVLLEQELEPFRLAEVTGAYSRAAACGGTPRTLGGGGKGEPASFTLPAVVFADKITVDFSSKGGPKDYSGTFNEAKKCIVWPDGNKWPKTA